MWQLENAKYRNGSGKQEMVITLKYSILTKIWNGCHFIPVFIYTTYDTVLIGCMYST